VLQDQEFQRLGGIRTIKVNIRLIAATNRDLAKSVAAREFRSDLYYRLHVFPVHMPPLRERGKDIELLVRYFVQRFSRRMNKQIETIPTETMNALACWEWARNVREFGEFYRAIGHSLGRDRSQQSVIRVEARLRGSPQCHFAERGTRAHPSRVARNRRSNFWFARRRNPTGNDANHSAVEDAKDAYLARRLRKLT
jgi:transcriptional regulator with GAF, ATPase, and Fis domain